jgi:hypothetical protein
LDVSGKPGQQRPASRTIRRLGFDAQRNEFIAAEHRYGSALLPATAAPREEDPDGSGFRAVGSCSRSTANRKSGGKARRLMHS